MPQAESQHTPIPFRCTVIKGSGKVAAAVAVGAAVTGAATTAQPSPDAELLAAFMHWVAATRAAEAISPSLNDEDFAAFCAPIEESQRKIAMMPATTVEGIAAKVYLDMRRRHGGYSEDWMAVCPVYLEPEELSILSDVMTFLQGWVRA